MDAALYDWVTRLVADGINHPQASDWERRFLKDQEERLNGYGVDTRMSAKQWGVLDRFAEKIHFEERPTSDDEE